MRNLQGVLVLIVGIVVVVGLTSLCELGRRKRDERHKQAIETARNEGWAAGFQSGWDKAELRYQEDAVRRGYGHWTIQPNGKTHWQWIEVEDQP